MTTASLSEIVLNALQTVKENEVFATHLKDEFNQYEYKQLEGTEFMVMKSLYENYLKNGNTEKFYGNYYAQVPLKSTSFFPGLTRNAATLLATKVADSMLSYCNQSKSVDKSQQSLTKTELSEKENAGLQYIGGYVLHKLYKKYARKSSPENQQAMAILKAGKLEKDMESQKLVSCLNWGGLWSITKPAEKTFFHTECYLQNSFSTTCLNKIDMSGVTKTAVNDTKVISNYQTMVSDAELVTNTHVEKNVFCSIVSLYIRVRSFSFAKDVLQQHKVNTKQTKTKALRKGSPLQGSPLLTLVGTATGYDKASFTSLSIMFLPSSIAARP